MSDFSLFVHQESRPPVELNVDGAQSVRSLLAQLGIEDDDMSVLVDPESMSDDDDHEPEAVSLDTPLQSVCGHSRRHVCICRCRSVTVSVNFECKSVKRHFSPTQRVRRVLRWALRELNLSMTEIESLHLRLCGEHRDLREAQRLSELLKQHSCELCFDLVVRPRVNG